MQYIDTHSHLYLSQFDDDRENAVKRAIDAGVTRMILPNVDVTTIEQLHALAGKYPQHCFPMMGLHPTSVKEDYQHQLNQIENLIQTKKYLALGEIGIDLYWDKTYLAEQITVFEHQINLAKKLALPIIIHARESFEIIFKVMDRLNDDNLNGIFHSFSGSEKEAEKIIDYGFKLGIGGVVTFKNSKLDEVIKKINLQHIVLETDAPYLAPVPFRGKRNESAYLINTAKKIAEIKNMPLSEIAFHTTKNAELVFNFQPKPCT